MGDRVGEPGPIVGDARAHALARMRQPPMLHVALDELPRRGAQQVLARHRRPRGDQRHAVLQLVAEAVGAARLIERRAGPDAAGQRLIQQPAVQHDVHRTVGRLHLDRAEDVVPVAADLGQHVVQIGRAVARDQSARASCALAASPRKKTISMRPFGGSTIVVRSAPHGIETGAHGVGERRRAGQRRRAFAVSRCGR